MSKKTTGAKLEFNITNFCGISSGPELFDAETYTPTVSVPDCVLPVFPM